jgi:hypothetical protein
MERTTRKIIVFVALWLPLWVGPTPAHAEDQIDQLLRSGRVPPAMVREHGYSDFTDPVGRFLDLLAAGAFAEARALQPKACVAWLATRQDSPFTGQFRVWDTTIDLNALCAPR